MTTIQNRRGTASQWTTANPVLALGELGLETDTLKFKFGDGVTAWASQPYVTDAPALTSTTGTYASRPSAGSVMTGSLYYATDTLETYRATGSGGLATSWTVVPTGSAELAYAQSTTTFSITSGTPVDVTGLTITFTPGERPIKLEFGGLIRINTTPGEGIVRIMDGSTTVKEAHFTSPNSSYFTEAYTSIRKSGLTAGTSKTYKIQALESSSLNAFDIVGNAQWPMWIRASTL